MMTISRSRVYHQHSGRWHTETFWARN